MLRKTVRLLTSAATAVRLLTSAATGQVRVSLLETSLLAVALGIDAFAVALAVGAVLGRASARQTFRLSWHFGLFQFLMPVIGWFLGRGATQWIDRGAPWIAFAILFFVGAHMILESFRSDHKESTLRDPTKGWSLVGLSVATSLDALGVGLSVGVMRGAMFYPAIVIGVVAGALTLIGMHAVRLVPIRSSHWLERAGGLVLIALAFKMLLD